MKNLLLFLILSSLNSVAYEQQLETVGYPDTTTQVNVYTGWTNQGLLTFSGNAEVQNTQPSDYQGASGAGNIFFTNTPGTYFEISDFPPDTVSNIHIMYGIRNYDTASPNELLLQYSNDGVNYFPISDSGNNVFPNVPWSMNYVLLNFTVDMKNFRLRFTQTSATKQFRIDDISFSYAVLLTTKLKKFTSAVKDHSVQLFWTASSGSSREAFSVEKSSNGMDFISAGALQYAKGSGTFNYAFNDPSPLSASAYYRLKMSNGDGSYAYSKVISVQFNNNRANIIKNVYPLPAKDRLNIQIQGSATEKARMLITNISGKTLITKSLSLTAGVNDTYINIQSLSKGVYVLKVITAETTETRKITVGR